MMLSKKNPTVTELVDGIRQGESASLGRAITLVESTLPEHQEKAAAVLQQLLPVSNETMRVGITGVPGVGKSSFIEKMGLHILQQGKKLAVLAIDPSSEISKGSILGDKTRMEKLASQPGVFIRPSPSSGTLGGVARRTKESILLCEAAGYNYILVETVGVGQSETMVHQLTDFFLLLMLAGAGDELQGIKRGIMEIADALIITKADGDNLQKAKSARAEYAMAMHLFQASESGWVPPVGICSSLTNEGIGEVYDIIEKYLRHTKTNGYFEEKRKQQSVQNLHLLIEEKLKSDFYNKPGKKQDIMQLEQQIREYKISPYAALKRLFNE